MTARWRDKPRRTLRRHDVNIDAIPLAFLLVMSWALVIGLAGDGLVGYAAVALVVAVAGTRLAVLYLRRPLWPEDERLPGDREVPDDVKLRNEAEESAREHRSGTGF
jgi:hypothetical protein